MGCDESATIFRRVRFLQKILKESGDEWVDNTEYFDNFGYDERVWQSRLFGHFMIHAVLGSWYWAQGWRDVIAIGDWPQLTRIS